MNARTPLAALILLFACVGWCPAQDTAPKKLIIVAGKPSHPPRMHEFNAGVQLLAKCLRDSSTLEQAFSRYVGLRRERVEKTAVWARRFGNGKAVTNPIGVWMRDLMMPFFLKFSANPAALDWVYEYSIDWETPMI